MLNSHPPKRAATPKETACEFGQKQARIHMNKEEERKQIGKMLRKI